MYYFIDEHHIDIYVYLIFIEFTVLCLVDECGREKVS